MRGPVYLDSSALIKRYVEEPGSEAVRRLFLKAYAGDSLLSFSIWNIGEVLGTLDRARRSERILSIPFRMLARLEEGDTVHIKVFLIPFRMLVMFDSV